MDNQEQFIDNYGSVVRESPSMDFKQQNTEQGVFFLGSAPATISPVYQKMRYNRRLELIIQLAVLRGQIGHH